MAIFKTLQVGLFALALGSPCAQAAEGQRHILVFGDSISWGWIPTKNGFPTSRYPEAERWTTRLSADLGPSYQVMVNAVSGRTTDIDYATGMGDMSGADFNGLKALPDAIAAEMPLDLVVVFLGTNDLRKDVGRSPTEIAAGAIHVADLARRLTGVATSYPAPKVLVVIPPPLGDVSGTPIRDLMAEGPEKSRKLSEAYNAAASKAGFAVFDAGGATTTDGVDGIHFTPDDNRRLADAIAPAVRALFPN